MSHGNTPIPPRSWSVEMKYEVSLVWKVFSTATNLSQARVPYTPEASPTTPSPTSDTITTRSGLNIPRRSLLAKSLKTKGGRVQKKAKDQKQRTAATILLKPLSEIARDVPGIPVADIGAFVLRSTEVRLKETSKNKKPGQIKRPMNAFMLYRKAYQEVAKTQCAQNNHQHVSKVCGSAWPMEPDHIHEQFNAWATTERTNHKKAHPGYKFTPSKPKPPKNEKEEPDSPFLSEGEDSDWASSHGKTRGGTRARGARNVSRLSETPSLSFDAYDSAEATMSTPYRLVRAYPTPGQPPQSSYGQPEYATYDMGVYQHPNALGIMQDSISRTPSPCLDFVPQQSVDLHPAYMNEYHRTSDLAYEPVADAAWISGSAYSSFDGYEQPDGIFHDDFLMPQEECFTRYGSAAPMLPGYDDSYLIGTSEDWHVQEAEEGQFEYLIEQAERNNV